MLNAVFSDVNANLLLPRHERQDDQNILRPQAEAKGLDIKIGFKEDGQFSLSLTVQNYPLTLDLDCKGARDIQLPGVAHVRNQHYTCGKLE